MPESPGVDPEAADWSEYFDPATGKPYYYNTKTGVTQWDRPAALGAGKSRENDEKNEEEDAPESTAGGPRKFKRGVKKPADDADAANQAPVSKYKLKLKVFFACCSRELLSFSLFFRNRPSELLDVFVR